MRKDEYLSRLESLLSDISADEREDAMSYYRDYFEDAGPEREDELSEELGSPEKVAAQIKRDLGVGENATGSYSATDDYNSSNRGTYYYNDANNSSGNEPKGKLGRWLNKSEFYRNNKTLSIVLLVVVLLCTSPLWIGVVGGIIGAIIGVIAAIFGVMMGLLGAGIGCFFGGISLVFVGLTSISTTMSVA